MIRRYGAGRFGDVRVSILVLLELPFDRGDRFRVFLISIVVSILVLLELPFDHL